MKCRVSGDLDLSTELEVGEKPDAVLLDLESLEISDARTAVSSCKDRKVPVLVALPQERLTGYDPALNPDELVICPASEAELSLRIQQAVYRVHGPSGSRVLTIGDLSIDLDRYEVTVAGREGDAHVQRVPVAGTAGLQPRTGLHSRCPAQPGLGI